MHYLLNSKHSTTNLLLLVVKSVSEALSRVSSSLCRSSSPLTRYHQTPQHFTGNSNHSSRTGSPAPSFGSGPSSRAGSQVSLNEETCRKVASQVHVCCKNFVCYHCSSFSSQSCRKLDTLMLRNV